eukprot:gene4849-3475_t
MTTRGVQLLICFSNIFSRQHTMYPINTVYGEFRHRSFEEARRKFVAVRDSVEQCGVVEKPVLDCDAFSSPSPSSGTSEHSPLPVSREYPGSHTNPDFSSSFAFLKFDVAGDELDVVASQDCDVPLNTVAINSPDATERQGATEEREMELGKINGKSIRLLQRTEVLGRGSLSTVYSGVLFVEDFDDEKPMDLNNFRWEVACKEMVMPCTLRTVAIMSTLLDVRISTHHNHLLENLYMEIKELDYSRNPPVLHSMMINERAFDGSVKDMLRTEERLNESEIRRIARDALSGIEYFHLIGIVHNDIKPHNLLVCQEEHFDRSGRRIYKVADLTSVGFAASMDTVVWKLKHTPQQVLDSSARLYLPGTAIYMSPESCLGMSDSTANDIWSFGITMFHIATGHLPWTGIEAANPCMIINGYRAKYAAGGLLAFEGPAPALNYGVGASDPTVTSFGPMLNDLDDASYSEEFREFVLSCLQEDPSKRPTCSQLLAHSFLQTNIDEPCSTYRDEGRFEYSAHFQLVFRSQLTIYENNDIFIDIYIYYIIYIYRKIVAKLMKHLTNVYFIYYFLFCYFRLLLWFLLVLIHVWQLPVSRRPKLVGKQEKKRHKIVQLRQEVVLASLSSDSKRVLVLVSLAALLTARMLLHEPGEERGTSVPYLTERVLQRFEHPPKSHHYDEPVDAAEDTASSQNEDRAGVKRRQVLSTVMIIGLMYSYTTGGAYGIEESVMGGGALLSIVSILILPIIMGLPISLSVAELSSSIPSSAGFLIWIKLSMHRAVYLNMVILSIIYTFVDNALYPVVFSDYVCSAMQCSNYAQIGWRLCILTISCTLNILGVQAVGLTSVLLSVLTLSPFLLMLVIHMIKSKMYFNTEAIDFVPPNINWTLFIATVSWNVSGLEQAGALAEEVENPQKTMIRALVPLIFLFMLTYIPPILVGASTWSGPINLDEWTTGFWTAVSYRTAGEPLKIVLLIGSILSGFGLTLSSLCTTSRLIAGTALTEAIPGKIGTWLCTRNRRFGTYHWAIIFNFMMTGVFCSFFDFGPLVQADQVLYGIRLAAIYYALWRCRALYPHLPRPFRVPLQGWTLNSMVLFSMLLSLALAVLSMVGDMQTVIISTSIIAGSTLLSWVYCFFFHKEEFLGRVVTVAETEAMCITRSVVRVKPIILAAFTFHNLTEQPVSFVVPLPNIISLHFFPPVKILIYYYYFYCYAKRTSTTFSRKTLSMIPMSEQLFAQRVVSGPAQSKHAFHSVYCHPPLMKYFQWGSTELQPIVTLLIFFSSPPPLLSSQKHKIILLSYSNNIYNACICFGGQTANAGREVLCYPCALRMAILHRLPPPPTEQQVRERATCVPGKPLIDDTTHSDFLIVHETEESVRRCCANLQDSGLVQSVVMGDRVLRRPPAFTTWLCVACLGLYQFMDRVYSPLLAASIRRSPFADSRTISINISVHRSYTFTWLMASTRYFGGAHQKAEQGTQRPPEKSTVQEEMSNFKEFYVSDLRARIMVYLRHPHDTVATAFLPDDVPGIYLYREALEGRVDSPAKIRRKEEHTELHPVRTTQAFEYSGENEGVIMDISCSHAPTEAVVTDSGLPSEYGSNRGDCVIQYGVLYEYVQPYLHRIGWGPPYTEGYPADHGPREVSTMSCTISHANIFLLGNYRKMTRNLSQSPWFSAGERVGTFSLQEVIAAPVLPHFFPEGVRPAALDERLLAASFEKEAQFPPSGITAQRSGAGLATNAPRAVDVSAHPSILASEKVFGFGRYKFHSAGREDVDVRMLGTGRPFVLEIVSPSRERFTEADLQVLSERINRSEMECVEINQLRLTDASVTVRLARHSESKVKRYRCVVWTSRALEGDEDPLVQRLHAMRDVVLQQKTPLRVLHRRSLHTRERVVHSLRLQPINAHWSVLDLETQAGTYIKEFVHGDMGRTMPNLGTLLGCRADIVQLDVVDMTIKDIDSNE